MLPRKRAFDHTLTLEEIDRFLKSRLCNVDELLIRQLEHGYMLTPPDHEAVFACCVYNHIPKPLIQHPQLILTFPEPLLQLSLVRSLPQLDPEGYELLLQELTSTQHELRAWIIATLGEYVLNHLGRCLRYDLLYELAAPHGITAITDRISQMQWFQYSRK